MNLTCKTPSKTLIVLILMLILQFCTGSKAFANLKVRNIVLDSAEKVLIIAGEKTNNLPILYKSGYIAETDKYYIDIHNVSLTKPVEPYVLSSDSKIKSIDIAQFSATPEIVRLSFSAANKGSFDSIKLKSYENTIVLKLSDLKIKDEAYIITHKDDFSRSLDKVFDDNTSVPDAVKDPVLTVQSIPMAKPAPVPLMIKQSALSDTYNTIRCNTGQNIVSGMKIYSDKIVIQGSGVLTIKKSFTLKNPSRLILDINNSTVSNNSLIQDYTLKNGDIVKLGKFNDDTVRIVITAKSPMSYKYITAGDFQSIIVTDNPKINLASLQNLTPQSRLLGVKVEKKDDNTTLVRFSFSSPIIHSVQNTYDKIKLDLYNAKIFGPIAIQKTNQLKSYTISKAAPVDGGSSLLFTVPDDSRVQSDVSFDGKSLELVIKEPLIVAKKLYTDVNNKVVVIDAGHGGTDPGAQRNGISEKDINLDVALRVQKYLTKSGIKVVMTRDTDVFIPLSQRSIIANDANPNAFVSIHVNACDSPRIKGIEVHWYTPQSPKLAKCLETNLSQSLDTENRGLLNSKFYVIHHTVAPSCLVEIGFISNNAERAEMNGDERKDATAKAIAYGILSYLSPKYSVGK